MKTRIKRSRTGHMTRRIRRRGVVLLGILGLNTACSTAVPLADLLGHRAGPAHAHHAEAQSARDARGGDDHARAHPARARRAHEAHAHSHHEAVPEASTAKPPHPDPREGITADKMIAPERLIAKGYEEEAHVYAAVAKIPHVVDGIYCYCHCAERSGHYSLLSCFESGHAAGCNACLGSGKLAAKLHAEGKSLDEIREAVDTEFGKRAPLTP
jgi:hypothetical protein